MRFETLEDVVAQVVTAWSGRLDGRSFAVRCRRRGEHDFGSLDVEREAGAALLASASGARVDLSRPDSTVRVELHNDRLVIAGDRGEGPGGYPAGCFDPVLSLVSGGFDSMVATWLSMRRGLVTHLCLFRLGGTAHERAVAQVAHYLWLHHGGDVPVRFISVPFEAVLDDIAANVDASLTTVILKRQMFRAASVLAVDLRARALVTGECLGQVSSQTLDNLEVIDSATDLMVMRPLVMSGKQEIISQARSLGLESMITAIPEYCGAVSIKPTTRARLAKVLSAEASMDPGVLDNALSQAQVEKVQLLGRSAHEAQQAGPGIERVSSPGDVIIDIRHPLEVERRALGAGDATVLEIPFYGLINRFPELPQQPRYLLYCDQGVLSRLQAQTLYELGFTNVAVWRP